MQLLEKSISELDNVNCPRDGDKKQCQIPTWGVGTPGGEAWNWQVHNAIEHAVGSKLP